MTQRRIVAIAVVVGLVALPLAAAASEGGLSIFPELNELLILLALFGVLIFPSNKLVFEPLIEVLDERGRRIQGARDRAQEIESEADRVFGEYEVAITAARKLAEQDRRGRMEDARREQSRVTAEARGDAEAEMQRARAGVAEALGQAREELRSQSEGLAREVAGRVLGRSL
ncbi:MAG: ATP synthase F0 subunit B [Deltaproteobacteria bacterium]|nr:ATP synthase F0 subunit B [Deltaproteobacteria bacterium]MBW2394520.1 ATP synthase F0 subunit B [Deltaproteobacteria bacterium]